LYRREEEEKGSEMSHRYDEPMCQEEYHILFIWLEFTPVIIEIMREI